MMKNPAVPPVGDKLLKEATADQHWLQWAMTTLMRPPVLVGVYQMERCSRLQCISLGKKLTVLIDSGAS